MKYMLVQIALQDTVIFFERFRPDGDTAYLRDLWTAIGLQLAPEEQIPNEGAAVWHCAADPRTQETVVLTLPTPQGGGEAYFIGVLRQSETTCRVFALERSAAPPQFQPKHGTVLSEFAPSGRMNWGLGCEPVFGEFLALIGSVVADPEARPNTFTEMKLA